MHAQSPQVMRAAAFMIGAVELAKTKETVDVPPVFITAVGEIGVVNGQIAHAVIIKGPCF